MGHQPDNIRFLAPPQGFVVWENSCLDTVRGNQLKGRLVVPGSANG